MEDDYKGADAADAPDADQQPVKRRDYKDVMRQRGVVAPMEDLEPLNRPPTEDVTS